MKIQHVTEATGTQRECAVCNKPATKFGFASDQLGQKNKSSRTPLCEAHAVVAEKSLDKSPLSVVS